MRIFESIQFAAVVATVALPVVFGRRLRRGRAATVLVAAMVLQLVMEGFRWQLVPLEIATLLLAAGDVLWEDRRFRGLVRFRRGALGVIGLAAVSILPIAFPVPQVPDPAGPFDVGTVTVILVDDERPEIYGLPEPDAEGESSVETAPDEGKPAPARRLVTQVWYPAATGDDAREQPWNPDLPAIQQEVAGLLGLPTFALGHLADVPSHAFVDASPLDGEFPVVVGSHDWLGFRTESLDQIEALASHGFIVVVPDHTYIAAAVRFPDDGAVIDADERALPEEEREAAPEAYVESAQQLVEVMADDLGFILDRLGAETPPASLASLAPHFDLEHVGVFGLGAGGGAAARFCLEDERCDALLAMNPWVWAIPDRTVARELQIPSFLVRSEETWNDSNDRRLRGMAERSPQLTYWVGIAGAQRGDFTMAPLLSPFSERLGWSGSIDPERTSQIVDSYLVAFFERFLLGVGGTELDQPPPAEVDLELIR